MRTQFKPDGAEIQSMRIKEGLVGGYFQCWHLQVLVKVQFRSTREGEVPE